MLPKLWPLCRTFETTLVIAQLTFLGLGSKDKGLPDGAERAELFRGIDDCVQGIVYLHTEPAVKRREY